MDTSSMRDITAALRKTLDREGPCPASQSAAFIDPFGNGFLQDVIKAITDFYNRNQPGIWHD